MSRAHLNAIKSYPITCNRPCSYIEDMQCLIDGIPPVEGRITFETSNAIAKNDQSATVEAFFKTSTPIAQDDESAIEPKTFETSSFIGENDGSDWETEIATDEAIFEASSPTAEEVVSNEGTESVIDEYVEDTQTAFKDLSHVNDDVLLLKLPYELLIEIMELFGGGPLAYDRRLPTSVYLLSLDLTCRALYPLIKQADPTLSGRFHLNHESFFNQGQYISFAPQNLLKTVTEILGPNYFRSQFQGYGTVFLNSKVMPRPSGTMHFLGGVAPSSPGPKSEALEDFKLRGIVFKNAKDIFGKDLWRSHPEIRASKRQMQGQGVVD